MKKKKKKKRKEEEEENFMFSLYLKLLLNFKYIFGSSAAVLLYSIFLPFHDFCQFQTLIHIAKL